MIDKKIKKINPEKKDVLFIWRDRGKVGIETTTRNGSDIIEYIPLLKHLISKNYIIFLVGEADMYAKEINLDKKNIITYRSIKINRELFSDIRRL